MIRNHHSFQVKNGTVTEINDMIVIEDHFQILFNDHPVADMVASRDQLRELGAGFVVTEGIARCVDNVNLDGDRICVYADTGCDISTSKKEIGSSGGLSLRQEPGLVSSDLRISIDDVYTCTSGIETELWQKTGAVHCSVLFCEG